MPLDLTALGTQVRQMSTSMSSKASVFQQRTNQVMKHYLSQAGEESHWTQAVNLSRETATWLFAHPMETLDTVRDVPPCPQEYALVATDGSQIDIDRHGIADCYLINIGRVALRYGNQASAQLGSTPLLYYHEEDLYLTNGARRTAIEGNLLSARRDVEELLAVVSLADEWLQDDIPALALQDGTLIRWTLGGSDAFVQEHFLGQYLQGLERLRTQGLAVASYISRPRVTEITGTVRLMYCPDVDVVQGRGAKCNQCSDVRAGREPSCNICQGLVDADLLADRLMEGQRGPIFASMSPINVKSYGPHLIHFFSMRVGREIARIEIPRWVAQESKLVDRVHSLIYDQCVKGQGYPVALARAHEQAIVRSADRRTFQRMVEGSLFRAELPATASLKRESKEYSKA